MQPSPALPARKPSPITSVRSLLLTLGSAGCFHLAFAGSKSFWPAGFCLFGYLGGLWLLRPQPTARRAFWWGTATGAAVFVPQTLFLASLFSLPVGSWQISPLAPVLWLLVSLWHGLFLLLLRATERQLGTEWTWVLAPVFWLGLEYFRSEIWWLRFSWLAAGGVIEGPAGWWRSLGVYGVGGAAWALLACFGLLWSSQKRWRSTGTCGILISGLLLTLAGRPQAAAKVASRTVQVAGIQLEFPFAPDVLKALDDALLKHPGTELFVLSEYTFDGPPPSNVRHWCQTHRKWLVAGGKEWIDPPLPSAVNALRPIPSGASSPAFRNTAFVVGPTGQIEFTQAKAQPIQFFADGVPALGQQVWASPWGPIGIAICYDASYRHVMDELIRQGARALILPTMDVRDWGAHEHALNARQAELRQREYGVPVLRLASSGASILWGGDGRPLAIAPFSPVIDGALLSGPLTLTEGRATRPLDAWLAPLFTGATGAWAGWAIWLAGRRRTPQPAQAAVPAPGRLP